MGRISWTPMIWIGWGLSVTSLEVYGIFSHGYVGYFEMALVFLSSFFAGVALSDMVQALIGFAVAVPVSGVTLYIVLVSPALARTVPPGPLFLGIYDLAASMVFANLFPFTLLVVLTGGIIGSAVGETLGLY